MKSVLVPTDFSKNALNALKYACAYAETTNSKVIILHTYAIPTAGLEIPFTNIHFNEADVRFQAEAKMLKLANSLKKLYPGVKLEAMVMPGIASENILDYAGKKKVSLIIMGTTGQSALARIFIGSTTSDVLSSATCSVLAVPPKAKFKGVKNILFAADLKSKEVAPLKDLIAFAKKHDALITMIHVQEFENTKAGETLQKLAIEISKKFRYRNISCHLAWDFSVADGLTKFIKKQKPDALVMITDKIKFPESIWKTSWTKEMSNHSSIPILVLSNNNLEM